jgi:hypothetical protein
MAVDIAMHYIARTDIAINILVEGKTTNFLTILLLCASLI